MEPRWGSLFLSISTQCALRDTGLWSGTALQFIEVWPSLNELSFYPAVSEKNPAVCVNKLTGHHTITLNLSSLLSLLCFLRLFPAPSAPPAPLCVLSALCESQFFIPSILFIHVQFLIGAPWRLCALSSVLRWIIRTGGFADACHVLTSSTKVFPCRDRQVI